MADRSQQVRLEIDDPKLRIASITIELYGEDRDPDRRHEDRPEVTETVEIQNWGKICPPHCQE